MTVTGTIGEGCYSQHCNGAGTAKELLLFVSFEEEDDSGKFIMESQIVLPLPYAAGVGDRPELKGRTITITIN